MGNITDECWPVRETATSGDNLVTCLASVRLRVFHSTIFMISDKVEYIYIYTHTHTQQLFSNIFKCT